MPQELSIKAGFTEAKAITAKFAKTFYFASHFLPKEKRMAAYSVYSVCRISDESVDTAQEGLKEGTLARLRQEIDTAYGDSPLQNELLSAFRETINKYAIPKKYFDELIAGMHMDLEKNRYDNFDELSLYCRRVAGVVGLMMLKIFGYSDPAAEKYAEKLGIAMQLTNILRDIAEDASINRIYLPLEELKQYGLGEDDIFAKKLDEKFVNLLKFQIVRARQYYEESLTGIKLIDDAAGRFTVLAMEKMYCGILQAIERNNYDVFSRRAQLSPAQKTMVILKILFSGKYL
ncbi:MAG: phytoene/squalene synthase family protein [Candidatus Omnitrophota bacterium]